jgi:hypothetical protein
MANARPFSISMLQDLSNDTKNTSMRGVLGLAVEPQTFGSLGGLQVPNFGSVGLHPHTWPKWGCDISLPIYIFFQIPSPYPNLERLKPIIQTSSFIPYYISSSPHENHYSIHVCTLGLAILQTPRCNERK